MEDRNTRVARICLVAGIIAAVIAGFILFRQAGRGGIQSMNAVTMGVAICGIVFLASVVGLIASWVSPRVGGTEQFVAAALITGILGGISVSKIASDREELSALVADHQLQQLGQVLTYYAIEHGEYPRYITDAKDADTVKLFEKQPWANAELHVPDPSQTDLAGVHRWGGLVFCYSLDKSPERSLIPRGPLLAFEVEPVDGVRKVLFQESLASMTDEQLAALIGPDVFDEIMQFASEDGSPSPVENVDGIQVDSVVVYTNDFDDLEGLTLFGSPKPILSKRTPSREGTSFDNNGDPNHDSGAILEGVHFDYRQGGVITADFYCSSSPRGCWLSTSISIGTKERASNTQNPGKALCFMLRYDGAACWQTPEDQQRQGVIVVQYPGADGERYRFTERFDAKKFNDRWVPVRFEVSPEGEVMFFADGEKLWQSDDRIADHLIDKPIWLGNRSSRYGDALIDNLRIYQGSRSSLEAADASR